MNPLINVTVLPPRPFFSILTRSFCCFLSNVSTASSSTLSYLKSGFVLDHKKINAVVDDSIKKLRIKTPSMKEHIANLSGGNQQKALLGKWMFTEPDILILDEVLSVGDAKFRKKCENRIQSMFDKGVTVIFVSHSTSQVLRMCNKGILLEQGRLVAQGDVEDVVSVYEAKMSENE